MANSLIKRRSTSLIIREMHMKTTVRDHCGTMGSGGISGALGMQVQFLAQWIKDLVLLQPWRRMQLQLGSDPWPGNFVCHFLGSQKQTNKKNTVRYHLVQVRMAIIKKKQRRSHCGTNRVCGVLGAATQIWAPAWHNGLRILSCCTYSWSCNYGLDLIPDLGMP